jgi:hypothetical protein
MMLITLHVLEPVMSVLMKTKDKHLTLVLYLNENKQTTIMT